MRWWAVCIRGAIYLSFLCLGVVSHGNKISKIEGLCLQSSHPESPAHKIEIQTGEHFDHWTFYCSCKAGNGSRCKHIYAALLHIHTEKSLKILTCTDMKQNWGKVTKEVSEGVLEPEIIRNLPEFNSYQPKRYKLTEEDYDANRAILLSAPKSSMAKFVQRAYTAEERKCFNSDKIDDNEEDIRAFLKNLFASNNFNLRIFILQDIDSNLLNFYNKRICLTVNDAIKMNVKTIYQKNQLWRSERKLRITAISCYNLFTAAKNRNVEWANIIATYFKDKPDNKNMKIGRREELNAIKVYENETNEKVVKFGLIVHPSYPWLGCSPDGFVFSSKTVVEVKTLINEKDENFCDALARVAYLVKIEGRYCLRQKHKHYAQAQLNMHYLCSQKTDLVVYNYKSKEIYIVPVNYDKKQRRRL